MGCLSLGRPKRSAKTGSSSASCPWHALVSAVVSPSAQAVDPSGLRLPLFFLTQGPLSDSQVDSWRLYSQDSQNFGPSGVDPNISLPIVKALWLARKEDPKEVEQQN